MCPLSLYPIFSHEMQANHWVTHPHTVFSIFLHIRFLPRELLHNVSPITRWQVDTEQAPSHVHFHWLLFDISFSPRCRPYSDCWLLSACLLAISEVLVFCQGPGHWEPQCAVSHPEGNMSPHYEWRNSKGPKQGREEDLFYICPHVRSILLGNQIELKWGIFIL